jgi:hypothetical protein
MTRRSLVSLAVLALTAGCAASEDPSESSADLTGAQGAGSHPVEVSWDFHSAPSSDDAPRTSLGAAFTGAAAGRLAPQENPVYGSCYDQDIEAWAGPEQPVLVAQCGYAGNYTTYAVAKKDETLVLLMQQLDESGPPGPVETVASDEIYADSTLTAAKFVNVSWAFESLGTGEYDAPRTGVKVQFAGIVANTVDLGEVYGNCGIDDEPRVTGYAKAPLFTIQCGWAGAYTSIGVVQLTNESLVVKVLPLSEDESPDGPETAEGSPVTIPEDAQVRMLGE